MLGYEEVLTDSIGQRDEKGTTSNGGFFTLSTALIQVQFFKQSFPCFL